MAWPFVVLLYNGMMAPAPMPVYLPNGFIYDHDWKSSYGVPNIIKDKHDNVIVLADVIRVMWYKDTIYGFRRGLSDEPYYFICTYGNDCANTQHLQEKEFFQTLEKRGVPKYQSRIAKTYDQLLWEQSKTYTGKGG